MNKLWWLGISAMVAVPCLACGPTPPAGTGGTGGSGGSGGTGGSTTNPFCAVKTVLQAKCQSCHNNPPNSGAPMPLVTYADTQANSVISGQPIWQLVKSRVAAGTMPPANAAPATDQDKAVIAAWNGSGSDDCGGGGGNTDGGIISHHNCTGEGCLSCPVTAKFLSHDPANPTGRFQVPGGTTDDYRCFTFKNPYYGTSTQATAATPIIDAGNPSVIHHWLLFGSSSPPSADGGVSGGVGIFNCVSPELGDHLLDGWAPGGDAYEMPSNIGLAINEYPYLVLQSHFNNPGLFGGSDRSGAGYCITPQNAPRPITAGIVTLGTDNISIPAGANNVPGGQGTCNNLAKTTAPVYILGAVPHMHKLGSGFVTTHTRGGTKLPDVVNIPLGTWRFDGQVKYPAYPPIQVNPGDGLTTTCYYSNPGGGGVGFGVSTTAEMCYDFVLVYPTNATRRECGQGVTFNNQ